MYVSDIIFNLHVFYFTTEINKDDHTAPSSREETPGLGELSEIDKLNELGKPRLGDIVKCIIKIKESKEFKVILISAKVLFCLRTIVCCRGLLIV